MKKALLLIVLALLIAFNGLSQAASLANKAKALELYEKGEKALAAKNISRLKLTSNEIAGL